MAYDKPSVSNIFSNCLQNEASKLCHKHDWVWDQRQENAWCADTFHKLQTPKCRLFVQIPLKQYTYRYKVLEFGLTLHEPWLKIVYVSFTGCCYGFFECVNTEAKKRRKKWDRKVRLDEFSVQRTTLTNGKMYVTKFFHRKSECKHKSTWYLWHKHELAERKSYEKARAEMKFSFPKAHEKLCCAQSKWKSEGKRHKSFFNFCFEIVWKRISFIRICLHFE